MELLERERCLADLTEWLNAAAREGCIALVSGEAGIGKTSLLQEFSKHQKQVRVLWGACDALFTPRPLAPLHDIARQAQGALSSSLNSDSSRDVIFSAALDELEQTKSLVVFEDMHWADEATLDLLKFLARRIQRTRSMLAITYRDDEVGPRHPLRFVIGDLPRASTHRLPLSPLSELAVAQLANQAGRSPKGLHSITGGNPLFVTELLAAVADTVPVTVRDAVLARVVKLSSEAREIAELASVVPNKMEGWLLKSVAYPTEAGIEGCLSMGMVRHEDGSLAFRHELTRRALEDSLTQPRQQTLHSKVLDALKLRPDIPVARLAHHADGARNADDVLRFATLAASQAKSVGAHREAASHYQTALQYAETLPPKDRALLHEKLSYECYLTDQVERSIEARRASLEIWRALGERMREGDTLRWLSRLSWFAGRRAEANLYADESIVTLESLPPGPELAMAYSNRAQLDMLAHQVNSAIDWAQRTIKLAEPLGNNEILSHALNNLGTARLIAGIDSGWEDLERSLRIALANGYQEHVARAYTNLSSMAVCARKYAEAARYLNAGIAYSEQHDLDSWRLYKLAWRSRARFEQGDWAGAAEDAEAVLKHPRTAAVSRVPALIVLGHLRIRRGDPDAIAVLEEARTRAGTIQELQRSGPLAAALAEAAWFAGDTERLIREVQDAYALALRLNDVWLAGDLAIWLWRVDALDQIPDGMAEPHRLEVTGNWREAAHSWHTLGCPYEQAMTLAWNGAEADQREALTIFEQLGATPATLALRKQMRMQGVRGVPRGARTSTRSNPLGLTKREAEILELLSDGLRNSAIAKRLFVSTKTVDHHVSAILTKLGVPSRAEAAAMARKKSDK